PWLLRKFHAIHQKNRSIRNLEKILTLRVTPLVLQVRDRPDHAALGWFQSAQRVTGPHDQEFVGSAEKPVHRMVKSSLPDGSCSSLGEEHRWHDPGKPSAQDECPQIPTKHEALPSLEYGQIMRSAILARMKNPRGSGPALAALAFAPRLLTVEKMRAVSRMRREAVRQSGGNDYWAAISACAGAAATGDSAITGAGFSWMVRRSVRVLPHSRSIKPCEAKNRRMRAESQRSTSSRAGTRTLMALSLRTVRRASRVMCSASLTAMVRPSY